MHIPTHSRLRAGSIIPMYVSPARPLSKLGLVLLDINEIDIMRRAHRYRQMATASSRSTSDEAEAFTSIAILMRGPWSASSRFWIAGDDHGSDGVCGRLGRRVDMRGHFRSDKGQ
jgi:hypothetical protein